MLKQPNRLPSTLAIFALMTAAASAQDAGAPPAVASPQMPDTEIFVGSLNWKGGLPRLQRLANVTRHKGYDNQPWFPPGERAFYFVSEGETGKTDIWRYDIKAKSRRQIFSSPDVSEYSPRLTPDGARLSYIQENEAGDMTRVFTRALDESDEGAAVVDFAPLGYYAWLDRGKTLAVYYRSEPGKLYRVNVATGEKSLIQDGVGRALQSDAAGESLWFTTIPVSEDGPFRLMRYDSRSREIATLFDLPKGDEDYAVIFSGGGAPLGVFAAGGSILYYSSFDKAGAPQWVEIADLTGKGIREATRLAVSDDRKSIAIVAQSLAE